ncbi:MAG TPA: right-handed parallel beta-helix repeat-containing protein [Gaiellaceae bacterium]|nr:right-handed parallel beta-helix repeat-containing protein [Gaiellaceae bacterium]
MSYTLRGRIESRLAAAALPFLVVCVLAGVIRAWWPVELVGAMVGVGLALDVLVYQRLFAYQPGWAAVPLGVLELGLTMALVRLLGIDAPLEPALWLFVGAWLVAQLLGHAVLPFARLTYAEDGGELGPTGSGLALLAPVAVLLVLGTAAATQPPTYVLGPGVHEGPIVLDRPQTVEGGPGVLVRGGIVVTSNGVTLRDLVVVGGRYGIEIHDSENVRLENVVVSGAEMDGIHARRSAVTIRGCTVRMSGEYTQAIDISFAFDLRPSRVERCTVVGGAEGIVSHMARVDFERNHVRETTMRAIAVTEMSMGTVERNVVENAVGVGVYCGDYSHCEITRNVVRGTRSDTSSSDRYRHGHAILSHFHARATVSDNVLEQNENDMKAAPDSLIRYR